MKNHKVIILLLSFMAIGLQNLFGGQVKVVLTTDDTTAIPTKVTLYRDTMAVASQSFFGKEFKLPDVEFNKIRLEAQSYRTIDLNYNKKDTLLNVSLHREANVQLKEVVVTASTTMKSDGINTKFENVSNGYLGKFHSGMETLEWTPGLMKINGTITVPEKGTPLIYIDDRRISSQKELKGILSQDISSIEIIREPGGEYPPGTTSVIRIRMKKRLHDYVSLSPNVKVTQRSHNTAAGVSLNSNFRFNKVSGTVSAEYYHGGSSPSSVSDVVVYDPQTLQPVTEYNTTVKNRYISNDVDVFAGISYDINSKSRIQAQYSGGFYHGNTHSNTQIETKKPNSKIQSYRERQCSDSKSHNVGLGYYLDTDNTTFSVRASYNNVKRKLNNSVFYDENDNSSVIYNPTSYKAWLSYIEFMQKIGQGVLSAGYNGSYSTNSNDYYTGSAGQLTDVTSKVFSGYLSYSHNIRNVSLRGSVSYTYDYLKCNESDNSSFSKTHNIVDPSASVSWRVRGKTVTLSFRQSGVAPAYYKLNPNVEFIDSLNYYQGNLNLDYFKNNNLTLSFGSWKDFSTSLGYMWSNNYVVDSYTSYDRVKNAILTQPQNEGKYKIVDLDLTYSLWHRKYNIYASTILKHSSNEYPVLGGKETHNQLSWMLMLNARYTIAGKYNIFTNSWYQTPTWSANMRMGHTLGVNIGISTSFLKNKLKVTLTGYDLFNKTVSPSSSRIYSNNVMRNTKFDYDGRSISLSITYTFNKVKTSFDRDYSSDGYTRRTESR